MAPFDSVLILSSTDTTAGFLARDPRLLDRAKGDRGGRRYIRTLPSLRSLGQRVRVPRYARHRVRRSRRSTFVYATGESWRVVFDPTHRLLLDRLRWCYSSSANRSGAPFDSEYAREQADIVVHPLRADSPPSAIYRLGRRRMKKLR